MYGELNPVLTYFTSEAWFHLNGHSNTHNSRHWSVHKPKEPYGVQLCRTEFFFFKSLYRAFFISIKFKHQQMHSLLNLTKFKNIH